MPDPPSPSLGAAVRRWRVRAGLSQAELAERAGLTVDTVSAIERGRRGRLYPQTARALAAALGLDPAARTVLIDLARGDLDTAVEPQPDADAGAAVPAGPLGPVLTLPAPLSSLVGRERDVTAVALLVREGARLVTLVGPGGVGKTRLAIDVARTLRPHVPDGGWFVDPTALTDPALVTQSAARALGIPEQHGRSLVQALIDALRARATLLVLDNCEQVIGACAALAEALLGGCPHLTVLATSREPLAIAGERVYLVRPLPVPPTPVVEHALGDTSGGEDADRAGGAGTDSSPEALRRYAAVELFIERARAVRRDFAFSTANAPAIVAICRQLDGLPLAIELAAARVRTLQPEQIARRLDDRFRLLSNATRTAPARHQTLRALIDWSHDLLTDGERTLLCRLAVFVGGWSLEAAEVVCSDGGIDVEEVLDLLTALVDKSLVVAETVRGRETRYRMLETVRAYAADRLHASGADEIETLHRRLLAWGAALAEEAAPHLQGPDLLRWYDRLEQELDNVRAALAWALATDEAVTAARLEMRLGEFWTIRGTPTEGRRWIEALLARALPVELRTELLNRAAYLSWSQSDLDIAAVRVQEALDLARATGQDRAVGDALRTLGLVEQYRGNMIASRDALDAALAAYRRAGAHGGEAAALTYQGNALMGLGDAHAARAVLLRARDLAREHGLPAREAAAGCSLGVAELLVGDLDAAQTALGEAAALGHTHGSRMLVGMCLLELGYVAGRRGQAARSARLFGAAEALHEFASYPVNNGQRRRLSRIMTRIQEELGEEAFTRAWAEGRAMSTAQAVAYAREGAIPATGGAERRASQPKERAGTEHPLP